ncbi:MAG TPA: glycosyltransferase [Planctomycetota bacterium]|nr:glycosyltransferase [Planctomycetota bacterium]
MRVLLYCQPLTGLGHYARTLAIARELAKGHEVHLASGGRPFPGGRDAPGVHFVDLPVLWREEGKVVGAPLDERRRLLADAVARIRPDVLVIEHFPFSKWELAGEALAAIDAAKGARIVCSHRDIALGSDARACATLEERFDALLVHGDPLVTRLEDQLPWAREIPVPVTYTGYVCGRAPGTQAPARRILASAGGGAEAGDLLPACIAAAKLLKDDRALVAFAGPFLSDDAFARLRSEADVRRFTPDLAREMAGSDLSVSRAGYNTCADILLARARAVVVPSPKMSDQRLRARRLAELGVVEAVAPEEATPETLAKAMRRALARPRPEHTVALAGAKRTREILEALVSARRSPRA